MKCSRRTVQRAVDALAEDRRIEISQIGENGTVTAHIINDRVAWSGKRDGLRYSLFSAAVILSEAEQPDFEELGQQEIGRASCREIMDQSGYNPVVAETFKK